MKKDEMTIKAKIFNNKGDVKIMESLEKNEANNEYIDNEGTKLDTNHDELPDNVPPTEKALRIEDIIEIGKRGVSNFQMIPAMKKIIAEGSIEKLQLLKTTYSSVFEGSIRYLKKGERQFIQDNVK